MEAVDSASKITDLEAEIEQSISDASSVRVELLRHYLCTYILYLNLPEEERKISPMEEELTRLSILLEKVQNMKRKLDKGDAKRVITLEIQRGKHTGKRNNNTNPRVKYRKNAQRLLERTAVEEDFNISSEKKSSKK